MFSVILNKLQTIITKKERPIFLLGCVFLAMGVLSVTILPYVVNNFIQDSFISIFRIRNFCFAFYALSLICYLFSGEYTKEQIQWVLITFGYYVVFQVIAKLFS